MRLYLTVAIYLLGLAACSETTDAPLSPQASGLELANGMQRTLLSDLSYSGTEVGGGATFSFDLPSALSGVFSELVAPSAIDQPCWFKFVSGDFQPQWFQIEEPQWVPGEEPNWDHGEQPDWVQGVELRWIQGAGLIRETPFPGKLLGLGTIEVPVTGTKTENGQVIAVEGTLVIMLAEHVVEPKQGSPYFNVCGTECVRFSLQAFFFPVGTQEPCWIDGILTAQDA